MRAPTPLLVQRVGVDAMTTFAVALELTAAWCVWREALATALTGHLLASGLSLAAAWLALGSRDDAARTRGTATAAIWALCMPLVGVAGVATVLLPSLRRAQPTAGPDLRSLELPAFDGALGPEARHATGHERARLDGSPPQRVAALKRLRRMPAHLALPALRQALRDPDEDVRLLAFAIVDQRERALRDQIETCKARLSEAAPSPTHPQRSRLELQMGELLFELVHAGHVTGAAVTSVLDEVCQRARRAVSGPQAGAAHLLLARASLASSRWDEADSALIAARDAGLCAASIAPLRAEVFHARRQFEDVRQQLSRVPHLLRRRPTLSALIDRWVER